MRIIEVRELTKRFDDVLAVNSISLDVQKGEIFGLLGPNGAGKTTLIKMLCTLIKPTEGYAKVAGFDITKNPEKVRKSIGIVFQEPTLDLELTARENLDFHGRLYGMDGKLRCERIKDVLELVGLEEKADEQVKKFSGGMQRRLEIARGFMHFPKVLFLDEPTLGLDVQTRRRIWEYIEEIRKSEDVTIILTTHYIEEAEKLCDRVGIIDHGKIIALDEVNKLKTRIGQDSIEITTNDVDRLESSIRADDDLKIARTENGIIISVQNGEKFLPELFELAKGSGIKINSISMKKSSLEDVFVLLTGRKIRDGSNPYRAVRLRRR
jgi:ABC-2 type transport system ATP-binding protein